MKVVEARSSSDRGNTLARLVLESGQGSISAVSEPFDSQCLKLSVARVGQAHATSTEEFRALYDGLTDRLRSGGIDQLIRRVDLECQAEIWVLESTGYRLMDVGVILERAFKSPLPVPEAGEVVVRPSTDADLSIIAPVMVAEPWGSRYESDPAYRSEDVRELRRTWLWNSHRGRADAMLVGLVTGQPAGYVTCRLDQDTGRGDIELVGTLPAFRGRGVALQILKHALTWFSTRASAVAVRTQATNYAAINLYAKAGFLMARSDASFRQALTGRGERAV